MSRKIVLTLVVLVAVAPAWLDELHAQAPDTYPCCEGGVRPGKRCDSDADCGGICSGGARNGSPCANAGCPSACVGGDRDGKRCEGDTDCGGTCVGGDRDGKPCDEQDAGCPAGECVVGTCSNFGECQEGTCTGECQLRSRKKQPDNPTSTPLLPPVSELGDEDVAPTCAP